MERVAVVGGGLAGLVAARRLAERGRSVTLYEANDRLGGRVASEYADGYTMDRGFQVLFPADPVVQRELDLSAFDLGRFRPGAIIARPGERSILSDPLRDPRALAPTVFNHEVTLRDGMRAYRLKRELADRSSDDLLAHDDRSIADALADRGFSEGFRTAFAAPFFGGITLDRSLSTAAFVFEYAVATLADGRAALPAEGMAAISSQLAARARDAGVEVASSTPVESLDSAGDSVTVRGPSRSDTYDGAIVATDAATARDLTDVPSIPTETRGCVTQYFSLPTTQQLPVNRRLVLNAADARPNHVALLSEVVDGYAPDWRHLLSATFLGEPSDTDEALAAEVRHALASWFPENSFANLDLLRTHRIPDAQLVQQPGWWDRVPRPDAPAGPVVLAGEYTRWSSIRGALESGRRAAEVLLDGR